ncbi:hypothetical protein TH61_03650 [Rufibacter sp. DG15C]|uniref:hypothetical protein n=1 Tax=Rufibacter sp. DG15C TaxID=1379909 RepID=UPI00078EC07F|nr:hypothetical protein [Rufibacter sp. DG15C]AMM50459.1 hypothetical protein TH61_03650 [Rufibacter sp. DG15C]
MSKALCSLILLLLVFSSCTQKALGQNTQATNEVSSQSDLKAYILKESQEGGKFDFFTSIKGHEYDGLQVKPGIYAANISLAIYKWGKAVSDAGIKSLDEVYAIYSDYRKRPLNDREKAYLKKGFDGEL